LSLERTEYTRIRQGVRNHGREFPTPKTYEPLQDDRRPSEVAVDTHTSGPEVDTRRSQEEVDTRTAEVEAGRAIPVWVADRRRPEVEE
jgi:hypothetical protein